MYRREGYHPNTSGMKEIIKECQPVLAISIYHSLEDFYRIPQVIHELNGDYLLYVRHYRYLSDSETICYAIPKSRNKFKNSKEL